MNPEHWNETERRRWRGLFGWAKQRTQSTYTRSRRKPDKVKSRRKIAKASRRRNRR